MTKLLEKTKYFIIRENKIVEAFANLKEAIGKLQINEIIICDLFNDYVKIAGTNPWKLSRFEFLNTAGEIYSPKINEWSIRNIEVIYKTSKYIKFSTEITDPKSHLTTITKEIRKTSILNDCNDHDVCAVIESKNILLEYSQFSHWKEIEIVEENKRLKAEILKLRRK